MKKLFTILAAALFSVSMMAEDYALEYSKLSSDKLSATVGGKVFTFNTAWSVGAGASKYADYGAETNKFTANETYTITLPSGFYPSKVNIKGYSNDNTKTSSLDEFNGESVSDKIFAARSETDHTATSLTVGYDFDLSSDATSFSFKFITKQTCALITITGSDTPPTDPIINASNASIQAKESGVEATQDIEVTGANLTGSTLTATLSPAVDGLSVTLAENAITDGAISTTATLHYTQTENVPEGQTTLTLSDGTTSKEVTITYVSSVETWELQSISESTSWDFSKIARNTESSLHINSGIQLTATSSPSKNDEIVYINYANGDLWTLADGFDGTTMAFKGEYPTRNNQYCQNGLLRFNTTVPGYIVVKFSDTGSSASATAVKRYLVVNDVQTEYWTSREKTGDNPYGAQLNVTSGEIAVEAGDVTITGSSAIVVSQVTFTKGWPTAVDNTEDGTKAVKFIENGQMFIKKNGVVYNVLGTIVK